MIYVSLALFSLGLAIAVSKKNLVLVLLGIEFMLNAANLNFIYFSGIYGDAEGQVMTLAVLLVAAAEAALGLAIIVKIKEKYKSINPDDISNLKL